MSGLSIGLSTFNSCNKAGSIPHFTQHLSRYPNDYRALTWRGRAYSIIGKTAEAKADFQKACRVSSGSQKLLAQALIESIDGNMKQVVDILQNTTRQYPNCSEAWFQRGSLVQGCGDEAVDLSLQYLEKANDLAKMNSETNDPWYPWCRQKMGDTHFFKKQQVNEARKHYEAAVKSCNTLTIGHLGLSRCYILNDDLARAKTSFLTAKELNPVLVQWKTFDDFRRQVQTGNTLDSLASEFSKMFSDPLPETVQSSSRSVSGAKPLHHYQDREQFHEDVASSYHQLANYSVGAKPRSKTKPVTGVCHGGRSGGSSGNGGSSDGSDDDENDKEPKAEQKWKIIKKDAPKVAKYRGITFYKSVDKENWYTKIKASERHGHDKKSYLKIYKDKGRTIELIGSIDENFEEMSGKHESEKYGVIKKSDLDIVHRHRQKK